MFCRKCGSPVNEGEKFCSVCGEKVDSGVPTQQNLDQQPYAGQALDQQPYGQQPYGQQPYAGQPYGGQPYGGQQPKKSLKWLWITLSLVAVVAIAAVLIFVVLPGNNQVAISEGPWPFKGGTPQTEFVNDTFKVFSDAFDGFGNENSGIKELAKQPFDVNMDIDMKAMGQTVSVTLDAAYDNESLGFNVNAMGASIKMLLLEDVFYVDAPGAVNGVRFNSTADLSKSMSLEDRVKALVEGMGMQQSALSEDDYLAIAELFVNSIDEGCFKSSDTETTLTLRANDIVNILKTFADKLDKNEALKTKLEDYIESTSGTSVDVTEAIKSAASMLEAEADSQNFELVWEVKKENGKPVSMEITFDDGTQKYVVTFGYEKNGDSTDIELNVDTGSVDVGDISAEFSYKNTGSELEYSGSLTAQGQSLKIEGSEKQNGDKATGEITLSIPGTGDVSVEYDSEISIGMPSKKVKDDSRFKIDTSSATITDMSSSFGVPGIGGPSSLISDYGTAVPSIAPTSSDFTDPSLWYCEGYQDGGMWVEGQAMYFENGYVYFGQTGMSGPEIISSGLDVYGGVPYTFDGTFAITLTALDGTTKDYYYDGTNIWTESGTMFYRAG